MHIPRLLLGVTGSSNALQIPEYIHYLRQTADVITAMVSDAAASILKDHGIELSDTGCDVVQGFQPTAEYHTPHAQLPDAADFLLILPATGNTLCKCAHGVADTLVTAAVAAAKCPVAFAPSMRANVWESAPLKRAVRLLVGDGHTVITPRPAMATSTGESGDAVACQPGDVVANLRHLRAKDLAERYRQQATLEAPRTPFALAREG